MASPRDASSVPTRIGSPIHTTRVLTPVANPATATTNAMIPTGSPASR
jgi:hypothetical protein